MHLLYKLGKCLTSLLPLRFTYKIAVFAADIYYLFRRKDKQNLTRNLEIVLGTGDKRVIKAHIKNIFRNFAKYLTDFLRFSKIDAEYIKKNITIKHRENLDAALANGRGAILLSAHIGNWELGAAITSNLGYPLNVLVLDHKDRRVNDFFVEQRSACNVNVISLSGQLKQCFRVLKKNELLGIAGDRDFTQSGVKGDFFGQTAILPKGAAAISLRTGAPVVPTFLIRKADDTFEFTFESPIKVENTGDKEANMRYIMKKSFSAIEKYIKRYPDQWYAFGKIWE